MWAAVQRSGIDKKKKGLNGNKKERGVKSKYKGIDRMKITP